MLLAVKQSVGGGNEPAIVVVFIKFLSSLNSSNKGYFFTSLSVIQSL